MKVIVLDQNIKREAKARNMSINQMAHDCEMPPSVLHAWANGRLPSAKNIHHLQTLSEYFVITIEELLFGSKRAVKSKTLFKRTFVDGDSEYFIVLEKKSKGK